MPTVEQLEAQLELARLEAELVAAKDSDPGADRDLKHRVRAAREHYRSNHRSPSTAVEDGTAEPAPVQATATVKGGK
jgi:hypothetical protein